MQPQIRNLIAFLLPLPDEKPTTAVVKCDKTTGLDRKEDLFFIFADGLLLMETTWLVVAVTQHVALMVELLLLPLVISRSFKIAFDLSSAVFLFFL